jgi:hypothetical protein
MMIGLVPEVNRAFSAGAFGVPFNPGALPQADREYCAFGAKTTTRKRFAGNR